MNSEIRIRNFGPIQDGYTDNDGWLDIKKVTFFVGNQGSGKSTVAKLISTFAWIEKALVRGDYDKRWFERPNINRFKSQLLPYHRIDSYLTDNSVIEYKGDAFYIKYERGMLSIEELSKDNYSLPQIMYVPAERNFLAYIKGARELKLSSESLQEFNTEYSKAQVAMTDALALPINNTSIEYDKLNDTLNIKGEGYKIKLTDASSGFQSFVPLFLVSDYLARSVKTNSENKETMSPKEKMRYEKLIKEILNDPNLTDEQKRITISAHSAKFNKAAFINIVEEPEQNLYPSSQWKMLQSLLSFNNMGASNQLIITTHSPYLINYLTLCVKASIIKDIIPDHTLQSLIPQDAIIAPNELAIYEFDENKGIIDSLESYNGLPSDDNKLNNMLDETNELFAQLLEMQQKYEH